MQNKMEKGVQVEPELFQKYQAFLPAELLEIWKNYGYGSMLGGYLRIINPEDYQELLDATYIKGDVSVPILTTAFGDVLTLEDGKYIEIVRYKYGTYSVLTADFRQLLTDIEDDYFVEKYLQVPQYQEAVKKLGKAAHDECFGYVPLLGLGGSEIVENLQKVKIKEHIAIIAQLVGCVDQFASEYF